MFFDLFPNFLYSIFKALLTSLIGVVLSKLFVITWPPTSTVHIIIGFVFFVKFELLN